MSVARLTPTWLLGFLPGLLAGQGVTTAAIQGRVLQVDGSPVASATIHVTNLANGRRWEVVTRADGAFLIEGVGVGGPYRIETRAVGFTPEAQSGLVLALGQRLVVDFTLRSQVIELAPVDVVATADAVFNAGRTGPEEIVTRDRIAETPNLGRDFLALTRLSPLVEMSPSSGTAPTGGITIAGQNRLYNSFQIDGGANHDLYRGRLPGRETLPRPISLEALEEIQVLAAPFDVRHSSFAGGLINAVTRSGTNTVHGSVFGYWADDALTGGNATGDPVGPFTTWQYGGTIGGPIVRDRAQYFLSVDLLHQSVPDPGPLITDTAGGADLERIGISYASALRFQDLLRDSFGLDPGTLGPVNGQVRTYDVFGKVTLQIGTNSHLELSHHYTSGDRWGFLSRTSGFYFLSSFSQRDPSTVNASRLIWTSRLGSRWSNELILSRLRLDDDCRPSADYPQIRAAAGGTLVAGVGGDCPVQPTNSVAQDALEVTEHITGGFGTHALTVGIYGEALRFEDDWIQQATGNWNFSSLDLLAARRATRYQHSYPGPGSTGTLSVRARQLGLFLQDRWTPSRRVTLTLGLRLDVPFLPDDVATNVPLRDSLGIDTGQLPSGVLHWSPRMGFNYDARGDGQTLLRGGIGLLTGRPPYQWLGSAYRDQGAQELYLDCRGGPTVVPVFDPVNQPTQCANGTGPKPRLSYFEPGTRFPQNLKLALGLDHRLPGGLLGTLDVMYTYAVRQLYLTDANLQGPSGVAAGEGNRTLYGTIDAAGIARPARRDTTFDRIVRVANWSGDDALSISVQLRKRIGERVDGSAFYGFTRARDRMSLVNAFAGQNLDNTPLSGTLEARPLRTSYFEIPHRVQLRATVWLPFRSWLSVIYAGASGTAYTYVVTAGDANADGIPNAQLANDPVYVPRDSADIAIVVNSAGQGYASLDSLIQSEPCLREQRGRILERNSCRNPWFGTVNARLSKAIPIRGGRSLELSADVYNVLNLIRREWGQSRLTIPDPWVQVLRLRGYDTVNGRGIYEPFLRDVRAVQDLPSRWQVELSVRYVF